MTDNQFTHLLQRTGKAANKYFDLLRTAEDEYKRRYGDHPSDADDDMWIDSITLTSGRCETNLTAVEVELYATTYANLERINK